MTTFAGIDFDTHAVHVVLIPEEGPPVYERRELRGADAFERTRAVRDAMPSRGWWTDQGVVAVGIEEPAGRLTGRMFRIQGAILAGLPNSLLVEKFMPSEWRKKAGLRGNASKADVMRFVKRRWPIGFQHAADFNWPQDACDAYCLALAVSRLTEEVAA